MKTKKAYFCFEASPSIGAGHAIRSTVIADALIEMGWECIIVTKVESYQFIESLQRFKRVEPKQFYENPIECELVVIDNYSLDEAYEIRFRPYAKRILVIDDLANRRHDCDVLLDQTFGRTEKEYNGLVPVSCKVLAGNDYILLRNSFEILRQKALDKRKKTIEIRRILVSMGGYDSKNHTLKALEFIQESGFKGIVDIALGFSAPHQKSVQNMTKGISNECNLYINADMPKLIYDADLAIAAAGSSVWERCCLGLPSVLLVTARNQEFIYKTLISKHYAFSSLQETFAYFKKENYFGFAQKISSLIVNATQNVLNLVLKA